MVKRGGGAGGRRNVIERVPGRELRRRKREEGKREGEGGRGSK